MHRYKFLVVDFDEIFQPEDKTDVDIASAVYSVPAENCEKAKELALVAKEQWEDSDGDETLQERLESVWSGLGVKYTGRIDIAYNEGKCDHLQDVVCI